MALVASMAMTSVVTAAESESESESESDPAPSDVPAGDAASLPIDADLAVAIARSHVDAAPDFGGLEVADLLDEGASEFADASPAGPEVSVSAVVPTAHNATTSVYLQQQIDGIDVRGAVASVTVASAGDVVAAADTLRPDAESLVDARTAAPSLDVIAAAESAAAALDLTPVGGFEVLNAAGDAARNHELTAAGISRSNIPARLVHEPVGDKDTRLAWEFLIDSTATNDWWRIRIDAETGAALSRFNLVVHETEHGNAASSGQAPSHGAPPSAVARAAAFTDGGSSNPVTDGSSYRVFAGPAESPNHTAPADTRTLVSDPADAVASPFGWHDLNGVAGAETSETRGNNVDAYADRDGNNQPDTAGRATGSGLAFDFPYSSAAAPSGQIPAIVTNLFYWNNITHDFLYAYGFDEKAGNFQVNNYGNGGLGGDAVLAEAQDSIIATPQSNNNANFATPPDGSSPRMQMFLFCDTTPSGSCTGTQTPSSLDAGVITHEYAHGLSTRLTGGPAYDECLDNDEQQGEGWSDIIALLMTMQGDTVADRTRGIGTYVFGQPTSGLGIRGQKYATGGPSAPGGNDWTYDDIKVNLTSVHHIGSIWAEMLWEMTWALVDQHGFDADLARGIGGNNLATQLIIDGLKLQPCSPGFVDSRDAILQADAINNNGENTCLIWEVFAERGLGVNADQGSSDSRTDGTEDFTMPASCDLALAAAAPAQVGPGDDITFSLTARNGTLLPAAGVTISTPVPSGTTYVNGSATCGGSLAGSTVTMPVGALAAGESVECTFRVSTSSSLFGARVLADDFGNGLSNWRVRHGVSMEPNDWELLSSAGGPSAAFAEASDGISDQYLQLAMPITPRANTVMSLLHVYALEATSQGNFDGGVVEASTNGGSTWTDLGPMMTRGGYDGTIASNFRSPIAGRPAFTGSSGGLFFTDIDLSSFAGDETLVRLRLASDESEAANGFWATTDVRFTHGEVRIEATPTLSSSLGSSTANASTRVSDEPAPSSVTSVSTPITPIRLLDTRSSGETIDGQQEKAGKRSAGSSLTLPVAGRSSIPADARGVVVNVTAIGPETTGFFTVHPCLSPVPLASSLNYTTGVNLGNEIVAELDASGNVCIFTSSKTHITADVVGYLPASSTYGAVAPARLIDTRDSGGLAAGQQINLQVGGRAGVPDNVSAVIVNVTAIRPATSGFVTAHACLDQRPLSSSLNFTAGLTRGNEIVAEVDSLGKMCLFTSSQTNLSVDIVGYLMPGTPVNAVTPKRLLDTRFGGATIDGESQGLGTLGPGRTTEVVIGGRGGVPGAAVAAFINITAVRPAGVGFVTVSPCGVARPNASSLNFVGGVNGGNDIVVGLGDGGKICIFNSSTTDLTVDVTGYSLS